jgi:phenylalanyl-tRNA synthetase alpha chain
MTDSRLPFPTSTALGSRTSISAIRSAAGDEAALESCARRRPGQEGELCRSSMKTLGGMTPEERQVMGPALNGL